MALPLDGGVLVTTLDDLRRGEILRGRAIEMRLGAIRSHTRDQVLYVLERDEGIFVPAGSEVTADGTVISVAAGLSPPGTAIRKTRLDDQPIQHTGDRWYRELIQSEITQFVGSIPPGRAPDHFHEYEEVLCILKGAGFAWSGKSKAAIAAGSCLYLPRRQPHCLENTTSDELRLLGVFYPAGSPAVRYEVHERAEESPERG